MIGRSSVLNSISLFCAVVLSVCDGKGLKVYHNVTAEQYYRIPQVFRLDDFDECFNLHRESLYCYTTFNVRPENPESPSDTWKIIEELNSVPRNYRHDLLRHGICLPKTCPGIPPEMYAGGNGTAALHEAISECFTGVLKEHALISTAEELNCETKDGFYRVDTLDIIYAFVIAVFLVATVIGTYYEGRSRYKPTFVYNNIANNTLSGQILFAFSIRRNFERLRNANTSNIAIALLPIQGIRVYNMFFVTMCHTIMMQAYAPVLNTVYWEDTSIRPENVIVSNGGLIIQTYFIISGWLLSYTFSVLFENKKKVKIGHLIMAFLHRYVRLGPVFLLVIGFNATWLRHFHTGPVWQHFVGEEFRNCRKNWWINMLYLNNYIKPQEMCIQQSWSLSSDTQCFVLGLVLMMIVINKPRIANAVLISTIVSGIALSIGISYYHEYDIVQRSYPETLYTLFLQNPQWLDTYIRGHFAIPSYVQGLAFGYWFYHRKKENKAFITSNVVRVLWFIYIWAAPLFMLLIAMVFYSEGFETTRLIAALYHGTYKYVFGMGIGLFLFGAAFGEGAIMKAVIVWPPLQVLARVSFSVYLTHVTLFRLKYGLVRAPIYVTNFRLFLDAIGDFWCAIFFGTLTCLIVEMPVSALQKVATTPRKDDSANNNDKKEKKQ